MQRHSSAWLLRPLPLCARLVPVFLAVVRPGEAQDGILDTTFSSDGRQLAAFVHPPDNDDHAQSIAVQSDGKIVLTGSSCGTGALDCFAAIARFLPHGVPDPEFDIDGERLLTFSEFPAHGTGIKALARPQDGKLVVVGKDMTGGGQIGLARLMPDGAFDPEFGSPGSPGRILNPLPSGFFGAIFAAALTSTGQILVGGWAIQDGGGSNTDGYVVRFLENGELDTEFGSGGITWIAFDQGSTDEDIVLELAVQPDDKIVALLTITDSTAGDKDTGIVRLLNSGLLDPTFDGDSGDGQGKVIFEHTDSGGNSIDAPLDLALQPDGRILLAGATFAAPADPTLYFARLLADGSTDPTLDAQIVPITTPSGERGGNILVESDGKLLLSGYTTEGFCVAARYDSDGDAFDPSFGPGGIQAFNGAGGVGVRCGSSALAGGRLAVAGWAFSAADDDFFVARLTSSLIFSDGFESETTGQW